MVKPDSINFCYLDYHCDCLPANFTIQYPLEIEYSLPLKCYTCMKPAKVATPEVIAENVKIKEENYKNLVVDRNLFKYLELPHITKKYN